jgi:hypothetical protein
MRSAARLAVLLGRLSPADEARQDALLDKLGMPKMFPMPLDEEKAWEAMGLDKKVDAGRRVYILPDRIGKVDPVKEVDKALVLQAIARVKDPSAGKGPRQAASGSAKMAGAASSAAGAAPFAAGAAPLEDEGP